MADRPVPLSYQDRCTWCDAELAAANSDSDEVRWQRALEHGRVCPKSPLGALRTEATRIAAELVKLATVRHAVVDELVYREDVVELALKLRRAVDQAGRA